MDKYDATKLGLSTILGTIGVFLSDMIGGFTPSVELLLILMAVDIVAAIMIIAVFKESKKSDDPKISSLSFWKGICRKGLSFGVIVIAHKCDEALGINYIRDAVIAAFIVNESLSVFEHATVIGLPIPDALKNSMEVFRNKSKKG